VTSQTTGSTVDSHSSCDLCDTRIQTAKLVEKSGSVNISNCNGQSKFDELQKLQTGTGTSISDSEHILPFSSCH
jgi:hypothetical protein